MISQPELNVPAAKLSGSRTDAVVTEAVELAGTPDVTETGSAHLSDGSVTAEEDK